MSNAIVALISVALILSSVALTAQGSFRSIAVLSDAWQQMEVRTKEMSRTNIEVINAQMTGAQVDVTIKNSGQTVLRDFSNWDVVMQYYDGSGNYYEKWIPYTSNPVPGNDRWTVEGIYVIASTTPEVFQPNMFDPSEEMVIRVILSPAPSASSTKMVVIGTPNGVSASSNF